MPALWISKIRDPFSPLAIIIILLTDLSAARIVLLLFVKLHFDLSFLQEVLDFYLVLL